MLVTDKEAIHYKASEMLPKMKGHQISAETDWIKSEIEIEILTLPSIFAAMLVGDSAAGDQTLSWGFGFCCWSRRRRSCRSEPRRTSLHPAEPSRNVRQPEPGTYRTLTSLSLEKPVCSQSFIQRNILSYILKIMTASAELITLQEIRGSIICVQNLYFINKFHTGSIEPLNSMT